MDIVSNKFGIVILIKYICFMEINKFLNSLGAYILILIVGVGFLSVCNWTVNPSEWNGFSRFLIAVWVVATLKVFFDD